MKYYLLSGDHLDRASIVTDTHYLRADKPVLHSIPYATIYTDPFS